MARSALRRTRSRLSASGRTQPAAVAQSVSRTTEALLAAGVFFLLLGVYLLTHGGDFFVSDGVVMLRTTESIVERHTVEVAPDAGLTQIVPGRDGKFFSKYGLGQPLAATIPFWLAQRLHPVFFEYMWHRGVEGYFVSLFNQFVTALTGAVVFLLARRLGAGPRMAALLALAWGLCTLAWPYSKTFFSEPLFTLCLVICALGLLAYRQTSTTWRFAWLAVGAAGLGYALLTRISGATLVPLFVAYAAWAALAHPEGAALRAVFRRDRTWLGAGWEKQAAAAALAFGLPLLMALGAILYHNWLRFDDVFNNGYAGAGFENEGFTTPLHEGLAGLLLSPGKSLFLFVPLTALAVVAWPRFWRAQRANAALYGALFLVTLVQTALWWAWWGGWSWGPRFLVPTLPFLILGLIPLLQQSRRARLTGWALAALSVPMTLPGVLVDFNPFLADLQARFPGERPGTEDPEIYFEFEYAPLLEHLRLLAEGEHISVVTFDLERLGFSSTQADRFPLLVLMVFIVAVVCLALAELRLRKARVA